MTTSESKGRFFNETNRFESIRITNRIDSNRELGCSSLQHCSRAAVEQRTETAEFTSSVNELVQSVNATLLLPNFQVHRRLKVAW